MEILRAAREPEEGRPGAGWQAGFRELFRGPVVWVGEAGQGQGKEIREKVETSLDTEEEVPHLPDFQEPRRFTLLPKHHRDTHK